MQLFTEKLIRMQLKKEEEELRELEGQIFELWGKYWKVLEGRLIDYNYYYACEETDERPKCDDVGEFVTRLRTNIAAYQTEIANLTKGTEEDEAIISIVAEVLGKVEKIIVYTLEMEK